MIPYVEMNDQIDRTRITCSAFPKTILIQNMIIVLKFDSL